MVRRTKEEALETKMQILDAAQCLFFQRGVSQTSMADIARAARVSRGAVYWHFRNKSDVFDALFCRAEALFQHYLTAVSNESEPEPLARIHELGVRMLTEAVSNPAVGQLIELLFHRMEHSGEEAGAIKARQIEAIERGLLILETGLSNAVRRGQLPADLDVGLAAFMIQASLHGLLIRWSLSPDNLALAAIAVPASSAIVDMVRGSPALRRQDAGAGA